MVLENIYNKAKFKNIFKNPKISYLPSLFLRPYDSDVIPFQHKFPTRMPTVETWQEYFFNFTNKIFWFKCNTTLLVNPLKFSKELYVKRKFNSYTTNVYHLTMYLKKQINVQISYSIKCFRSWLILKGVQKYKLSVVK